MTIRHPSAAEARPWGHRYGEYTTTDELDRIARQRALAHYLRRWHYLERHIRACRTMPAFDAEKGARWKFYLWVEIYRLDPEAARMVVG